MAALAPVAPRILKRILELAGWELWAETDLTWMLGRGIDDVPIVLPKVGNVVALEVQAKALDRAGIDNQTFFEYRDRAQAEEQGRR